jgi:hypothetical protein
MVLAGLDRATCPGHLLFVNTMLLTSDLPQPTPEQYRERVKFIRQQAEKLTDEQKRRQLLALAQKFEKRAEGEPAAGTT